MTPHKIEEIFRAPAADIMDAILHGFRAQVDVKGKLAELYLSRQLEDLQKRGDIDHYEWFDKDGVPDFHVFVGENRLVIECKNVRSPAVNRAGTSIFARVELQKTRNGVDVKGQKTRGYPVEHFDILAVCLFNHTSRWEYVFIACQHLEQRPDSANFLKVFQAVPLSEEEVKRLQKPWSYDLGSVVKQEIADRRRKLR